MSRIQTCWILLLQFLAATGGALLFAACEGSLVLRREGRPIWWLKDGSPCRSEGDVIGFAERLAVQFASEWKAAQKSDPHGS